MSLHASSHVTPSLGLYKKGLRATVEGLDERACKMGEKERQKKAKQVGERVRVEGAIFLSQHLESGRQSFWGLVLSERVRGVAFVVLREGVRDKRNGSSKRNKGAV